MYLVSRELPAAGATPGVVVGVDGSDGSLWALDRAVTEAAVHGVPLYVVAAVNPAPTGYTPGMVDLVQESVERLLAGMSEVATRGIETVLARHPEPPRLSLHTVLGNPVEALLAAAAAHHTLVVGTRGNGGFARLLLGSVSTALVHHCTCPVLVVPAPEYPAAAQR
ncbi:universal stress protein [Streptacidiphilus sp. PB12-B1b]|uniref:universal stress protein n=1 Tax=Streptacidiphilus sp. PB12-B1b TaxID=2705012 RepID=UPI0015FBC7C9|nr:universal stress protein [Streptacidiphilus sp. PB12-B1b]QMU79660.1 universal stress protein [Streptacidiphilus sp. PB12-B1b]